MFEDVVTHIEEMARIVKAALIALSAGAAAAAAVAVVIWYLG